MLVNRAGQYFFGVHDVDDDIVPKWTFQRELAQEFAVESIDEIIEKLRQSGDPYMEDVGVVEIGHG